MSAWTLGHKERLAISKAMSKARAARGHRDLAKLTSGSPAQAIQFGSRLGRAANVRDWGSNRAANSANAGGVRLRDTPYAAAAQPGVE